MDTREYAFGTSITTCAPWGLNVACRAICPDGRVRSVRIAQTADTFFSTPASVRVRGKTVSGYVTVSTPSGLSTESEGDPAFVEFRPVDTSKNADAVFPKRPFIRLDNLRYAAKYWSPGSRFSDAKSKAERF